MVPKVMSTMEDRNLRIAQDLAAAQAARDAAETEQASWTRTEAAQRAGAQELVAAAKHKAALATQASLAETTARLEAQVSAAEQRILAARQAALAEFELVAAEVAQDITQRVAGLVVSADDARSAVKGPFAHG
jgi:F-type H+-transporting ATPase subunit b